MIDSDGIDGPVSFSESAGVVLDEGLTGGRLGGAGTGTPNVAGPVTTESGVEDDLLIPEVRVDVTPALKLCDRSSPRGWVGVSVVDIGWDLASWKEPYRDARRSPFCSVNTPSDRIEAVAIGIGSTGVDRTPNVGRLTGGVYVTVCGGDASCESPVVRD